MEPTGGQPAVPDRAPPPDGPPPPPRQVPLPPPPPRTPLGPRIVPVAAPPVVTEAVRRIPLGSRELLRQSLDLLTRRDTGLRGASFYIGFMMLVTVAPLMVIVGMLATMPVPESLAPAPFDPYGATPDWAGWLLIAVIPATLGYVAAGVEARSMATAVIGGRVEGRPLRLRESIAVARRRFWQMLGAQVMIGLLSLIMSTLAQVVTVIVVGPIEPVTFAVSLVVSVVVSAPFVYVPAGIVLGEVPMFEAISRSWRLARLRKRLAVVVTLFGVLSQFIVLFGLLQGVDIVARFVIGVDVVADVPRPLVVPIAATLVFALGTLTFLVEAIAAAPAVHAFAALTHYTRGLQAGRDEPVRGTSVFSPWLTPGLAIGAVAALLALLGALATMPA